MSLASGDAALNLCRKSSGSVSVVAASGSDPNEMESDPGGGAAWGGGCSDAGGSVDLSNSLKALRMSSNETDSGGGGGGFADPAVAGKLKTWILSEALILFSSN